MAVPLGESSPFRAGRMSSEHNVTRIRERIKRVFLVGSLAQKILGPLSEKEDSDVDILLEIGKNARYPGMTDLQVDAKYRSRIKDYYERNNINNSRTEFHPQWQGKCIDLHITFDANCEYRQKILLGMR